jgi:hypothetical protein
MTSKPADGKPWLRDERWAARVLTYENNPGWPILIIAYLFFGGLSLLFIALGLGLIDSSDGWGSKFGSFAVGGALLWVLGGLAILKIRHLRFGKSVCRLITVPGVIGGWFKADILCRLPPGTAPLVVRLENREGTGRGSNVLWRLQKDVLAPPSPLPGSRQLLVAVRLLVPRDPLQVPDPLEPSLWTRSTYWLLEIEKECRGVNFFATFRVPIYDIPNAPESEQRSE